MYGKGSKMRSEQVGILRLLIPGERKFVMGEWMVDLVEGKMQWRTWMKALHYQILQ
jgi:hypothetical protein